MLLLVAVLVLLSAVFTMCGENDVLRRQLREKRAAVVPMEKLSACLDYAETLAEINETCLAVGHRLKELCEAPENLVRSAVYKKTTSR